MDFPRGRGPSGKIVEFLGDGGGVRPDLLEWKIQGGGGSNWKNPPWGGGMDIFWNHTFATPTCPLSIQAEFNLKCGLSYSPT